MLKASRLHGDVDDELCEMFTARVSEITSLQRLVGVMQDSDEHEVIDSNGNHIKREKA